MLRKTLLALAVAAVVAVPLLAGGRLWHWLSVLPGPADGPRFGLLYATAGLIGAYWLLRVYLPRRLRRRRARRPPGMPPRGTPPRD